MITLIIITFGVLSIILTDTGHISHGIAYIVTAITISAAGIIYELRKIRRYL